MRPHREIRSTLLGMFIALAIALGFFQHSIAAEFPTKPIKLVVPWPAGSGPDVMNRILGEIVSKDLGQPVVIVNVVGAGGAKGTAFVRNERADGYTVLNNWVGPQIVAPVFNAEVGYDGIEDFEPIAGMGAMPFTLVVKKDHPASNLQEFVNWAKEQEKPLKFGACAAVSVPRMVGEEFAALAGINAQAVPYPGCLPDNIKSVLDGSTDYAIGVIQAEKMFGDFTRTLAIFTDERIDYAPHIPTAKELGYDIKWGDAGRGWSGIVVAKGTPEESKKVLVEAFQKGIQSEEFQAKSREINYVLKYLPPNEFRDLWVQSREYLTPPTERILKQQ